MVNQKNFHNEAEMDEEQKKSLFKSVAFMLSQLRLNVFAKQWLQHEPNPYSL